MIELPIKSKIDRRKWIKWHSHPRSPSKIWMNMLIIVNTWRCVRTIDSQPFWRTIYDSFILRHDQPPRNRHRRVLSLHVASWPFSMAWCQRQEHFGGCQHLTDTPSGDLVILEWMDISNTLYYKIWYRYYMVCISNLGTSHGNNRISWFSERFWKILKDSKSIESCFAAVVQAFQL